MPEWRTVLTTLKVSHEWRSMKAYVTLISNNNKKKINKKHLPLRLLLNLKLLPGLFVKISRKSRALTFVGLLLFCFQWAAFSTGGWTTFFCTPGPSDVSRWPLFWPSQQPFSPSSRASKWGSHHRSGLGEGSKNANKKVWKQAWNLVLEWRVTF